MLGHHRIRTALPLALAAVLGAALGGAVGAAPVAADPTDGTDAAEVGYTAQGEEVQGGASIAQAPTVAPGIHLDSFSEGTEQVYVESPAKYYRVDLADGERVHAAVTIAAPLYQDGLPDIAEGLSTDVEVVSADGTDCTAEHDSGIGEEYTGDGPITATAVSEPLGEDGCEGSALFVRVVRSGPRAMDQALPVEVQVAVEPSDLGQGGPSADEPVEDDGADPVVPDDPEPIEAGRSFLTAAEVEEGSVVLELRPGQSALLAIDVAEGQRLRWRTEATSAPGSAVPVSLRVFDAARGQVTVGGGSWSMADGDIAGGGMAAPIAVGNRSSEDAAIASAWLPGRHTVLVHREQADADADPEDSDPLRLVLTLEVEGEPGPDAADEVLELGTVSSSGASWGVGRAAAAAAAVLLGAVGVISVAAGIAVLVVRRRRIA